MGAYVEAGQESREAGVQTRTETIEKMKKLIAETEADAVDLAKSLSEQIASGEVEVVTKGRQIVLRIREKGSFASGSAELADQYIPLLHEVRNVLATKEGDISVQGHTDNIPINTARFRSNWDLSTGRAVSVAHELLAGVVLDEGRMQVSGYAATRSLVDNDSSENRAKNRRVEIIVHQGVSEELQDELKTLKEEAPEEFESLKLDNSVFKLKPHEIF